VPRTFDTLKKTGIPIFAYVNFFIISINFILLAFVIFQMVKIVNKIRAQDEYPKSTPPTSEEIMLLKEIEDLLKR
jgi:large conductance mechanosensitive channel